MKLVIALVAFVFALTTFPALEVPPGLKGKQA